MGSYFAWYYSQGLKDFFQIWKNYLDFFWYYFSIGRFAKILFAPWKRDVSRVNMRGLHPLLFLQALAMNIITRILGSIIKLAVIIFGLLLEVLAIIIGLIFLVIWLLFPLVLVLSLSGIAESIQKGSNIYFIFWSVLLILSGAVAILALFAFRFKKKDYSAMNLLELSEQPWFERVWNRIGTTSTEVGGNILTDDIALKKYLRKFDLTPEKFRDIMEWEIKNQKESEQKKKFWLKDNLMAGMPIGRNWAFAYTIHLDRYSVDLSVADYSEYIDAEMIGRGSDFDEIKQILLRQSQNNVILVGDVGVGKNTIVHTLAREIRTNEAGQWLENKRILSLDIKSLIADYSSGGKINQILNEIFNEAAYAGNIILVLKDMHEYVGNTSHGGVDISPIISEFLGVSSFQIIGLTTPEDFRASIEKKANVMKYCDRVQLEELGEEATFEVMLNKLRKTEKERVLFTYQALWEIIKLADRYISSSPFPEKALDLMEEAILFWSNNPTDRFITAEVVDGAVSAKIKIPIGEIASDESQKLLNLEECLHKRVVGQDFAINQIAETMRRARIGMTEKNKPVGSFLFLGPTGVGKTETAKALAETYFGDEERMIRLDMSEYQTQESIDRLIGSASNKKEGYLVSQVKENPFALLLLDEIEKAYPDILNLFLQVLDEGHLTDVFGKKISFRNLIIIATSNAGSEIIRAGIENNVDSKKIKEEVVEYVIKEAIFRPEFLNRFGGVIYFAPLSQTDISQVTTYLLEAYRQKLKSEQNVEIIFGQGVEEKIVTAAYDPKFGARAIDRYIQDKIGNLIADKIISGELKKGENFSFEVADMD